jgi:hypothetical protein
MSAESLVVKFLPLGDLLEEKELTIADPSANFKCLQLRLLSP